MYLNGDGVKQNFEKAVLYLTPFAEPDEDEVGNPEPEAQACLGINVGFSVF